MIYLDLETTSLNAEIGRIVAIGLILPDGRLEIFFAKSDREEKEIIQKTMEVLRKFKGKPLVIWYSKFDIPFLVTRAIKHGLDISDIYDFEVIDIWKLVKENLRLVSNRLDDASKFFGVKKNVEMNGRQVLSLYLRALKGDAEAEEMIVSHCKDDLEAMKKIYEKIKPYIEKWKGR